MANRSEQADTFGCNIVNAITQSIYEKVCDGSLTLWDSQKKEISISASTLKSIEKSSGVSFDHQETVFIYEIWDQGKKEITTQTIGFSFIHKRGTSEEVLFGYVDYKDVADLFYKSRINTNASGNFSATFSSVLDSKGFNYTLVQFGDRLVRTANESEDLKISFVHGMRFNATKLGYYPQIGRAHV